MTPSVSVWNAWPHASRFDSNFPVGFVFMVWTFVQSEIGKEPVGLRAEFYKISTLICTIILYRFELIIQPHNGVTRLLSNVIVVRTESI